MYAEVFLEVLLLYAEVLPLYAEVLPLYAEVLLPYPIDVLRPFHSVRAHRTAQIARREVIAAFLLVAKRFGPELLCYNRHFHVQNYRTHTI